MDEYPISRMFQTTQSYFLTVPTGPEMRVRLNKFDPTVFGGLRTGLRPGRRAVESGGAGMGTISQARRN